MAALSYITIFARVPADWVRGGCHALGVSAACNKIMDQLNIISKLSIAHAELLIMMHTVITFKLARLNLRHRPPTTVWVVYGLTSLR